MQTAIRKGDAERDVFEEASRYDGWTSSKGLRCMPSGDDRQM
jgi:hypothetical protein